MEMSPLANLSTRAAAFEDLGLDRLRDDTAPPRAWTPEHVTARVVDAMKVADATAGRIGPKSFGSNWPSILREFVDYLGYDLDNPAAPYYRDKRREFESRSVRRFSAEQLSMSDEAIAWPARHLADRPLWSDAFVLWCHCAARGVDAAPILKARTDVASKMRDRYRREVGANISIERDEDRIRQLARAVAPSANVLIADAEKARKHARSDKGAREAFRQSAYARQWAAKKLLDAVKLEKLIVTRDPLKVTIQDLMPGRVFSKTQCNVHRANAAAAIAEALTLEGVPVR